MLLQKATLKMRSKYSIVAPFLLHILPPKLHKLHRYMLYNSWK